MTWVAIKAVAAAAMKALPAISAVSTVVGAASAARAGADAQSAANAEAAQMELQGRERAALAQREAERIRKQLRGVQGRQRSLLAASGFEAGDVGAEAITMETVKEASVQELLALARGESERKQSEYAAKMARRAGAQAASAGRMKAVAMLVDGGVDWSQRYGLGRSRPAPKPKGKGKDILDDTNAYSEFAWG